MAGEESKAITNMEELRSAVVREIDATLTEPIVSRFMSAETARMLKAQRAFWQSDDGVQLNKLYSLFCKEP